MSAAQARLVSWRYCYFFRPPARFLDDVRGTFAPVSLASLSVCSRMPRNSGIGPIASVMIIDDSIPPTFVEWAVY
jgi:hypothetical protein